MIPEILLISIFLILGSALEWEPKEFIYHENLQLSENNPNVDLYVVEDGSFMPCIGPRDLLLGCSLYSPSPVANDLIFVVIGDYKDEFGMGITMHEILHVECSCDWHYNGLARQLVHDSDQFAYQFVMQHKENFAALEGLTGPN